MARALHLGDGAAVQKAVRVRATRDGPISRITTWVPARLGARFGRRELARMPILVLLEQAGVRIGRAPRLPDAGARLRGRRAGLQYIDPGIVFGPATSVAALVETLVETLVEASWRAAPLRGATACSPSTASAG